MRKNNRFGDKRRSFESVRKHQSIAQWDRRLIAQLRIAAQKDAEQILRKAARMRCPRCTQRLKPTTWHGLAVDECPDCQGLWLRGGELQLLADRESKGWLGRWFLGKPAASRRTRPT